MKKGIDDIITGGARFLYLRGTRHHLLLIHWPLTLLQVNLNGGVVPIDQVVNCMRPRPLLLHPHCCLRAPMCKAARTYEQIRIVCGRRSSLNNPKVCSAGMAEAGSTAARVRKWHIIFKSRVGV
jgi:hypothetical protein